MYNGDSYIQLHTSFRGIRVIDRTLFPTNWELTSEIFPVEGSDETQINIAIAKIHYLFDYIMDGAVFVYAQNKWASRVFRQSRNPCVLMPSQPADVQIAIVLQAKMNTLGGNSIIFGAIDLNSDTSSGVSVSFIGDAEEHLPTMKQWIGDRSHFDRPWWFRDDGSTQDVVPKANDDLNKTPGFAFSLDFITDSIQGRGPKAKIVRPNFRPRVVEGRKNESRQTDR